MHNSFVERIFPSPSSPLLPQHERSAKHTNVSTVLSPPRIRLRGSVRSSSSRSSGSNQNSTLQPTPLGASFVHHDDPFLPVERAAKALQGTIQELLDIQSNALANRLGTQEADQASSGSVTPTQPAVIPSRGSAEIRVLPIRQPKEKKITLRSARKGLAKSMEKFAFLRQEELKILDNELRSRETALERVQEFDSRRTAVESEIQSIQQERSSTVIEDTKKEAETVEMEIQELEHKLVELRAHHRHLVSRTNQLENQVDSKLSSYKDTLLMLDKERRNFLRRPPVARELAAGDGMYALKADRRTTEMAKEQWTVEQEVLLKRRAEVEAEITALLEGEKTWRDCVVRIHDFEQSLRQQTQSLAASQIQPPQSSSDDRHMNSSTVHDAKESMNTVLHNLESTIQYLETKLSLAEEQNWNLLICALGAEIDAFVQARLMLESLDNNNKQPEDSRIHVQSVNTHDHDDENNDIPAADLLAQHDHRRHSTSSNESLKATLQDFHNRSLPSTQRFDDMSTDLSYHDVTTGMIGAQVKRSNTRISLSSEDDDPGPGFMVGS